MATRDERGLGQATAIAAGGGAPVASPVARAARSAAAPRPTSIRAKAVATLVAIEGDLQGQAFVLEAGGNHLGRGAGCKPLLDSRWISRSHARVSCEGGQFLLRATEGKDVFVNDVLSGAEVLRSGDRIRLGTTVFVLRTTSRAEGSTSSVIPVRPSGSDVDVPPREATQPAQLSTVVPTARRKRRFWEFWKIRKRPSSS